jgi:nitrate/nitrite-specific signal transduction histidine kinase
MLGRLLAIVFVATVFSMLMTHYFILQSIVDVWYRLGRSPTADELMWESVKPLFWVIPIVLIMLAILVIFVSHRIAGPLERLKQYMRKVGEGNFDIELQFRKNDEIHDVADTFNVMVAGLKKVVK